MNQDTNTPSATHSYGFSVIDIALCVLIFLGIVSIFCIADPLHIIRSSESDVTVEEDTPVDIIALRVAMSDLAHDSVGIDGEEFYDRLTSAVDSAPTEDSRASLQRFFVYLALRHGFPEGAYYVYKEYMDAHSILSDLEVCELYDYRSMIAQSFVTNEDMYAPDIYESMRSTSCARILESDAYARREEESDYDYAHRLFYSGLVRDSIPHYIAFYSYQEDPDAIHEEARINISDFYLLFHDYDEVAKYTTTRKEAVNADK